MPIPCPGTDRFSQIFGAGREGATPFAAFVRALLAFILALIRNRALREFLNKECKPPCEKALAGPFFRGFIVRIRPRPGRRFHCSISCTIDAQIDCKKPEAVEIELSDKELLDVISAELRHVDKEKA